MFDLCDVQKSINLNCFFYENINQFNLFMRQINKNYEIIQKIKMKKKTTNFEQNKKKIEKTKTWKIVKIIWTCQIFVKTLKKLIFKSKTTLYVLLYFYFVIFSL